MAIPLFHLYGIWYKSDRSDSINLSGCGEKEGCYHQDGPSAEGLKMGG